MQVNTRVVLPRWCWQDAQTKEELKRNISYYMKRYPGYQVIEIGKYYAICHRSNDFQG